MKKTILFLLALLIAGSISAYSSRIDLSWDAVPDAAGYCLYVGLTPDGAFTGSGKSAYSAIASATTLAK